MTIPTVTPDQLPVLASYDGIVGALGSRLGRIDIDPIALAGAEGFAIAAQEAADEAAASAANFRVATIAALKALVPVAGQTALLTDPTRPGPPWVFLSQDFTTQIAADVTNGVYAKANTIAASVGAWQRIGATQSMRPQWFGARGNGVLLQDGAMTAGSNVFNSASAKFTASDVGKMIKVGGAGTSGATLITTIATVVTLTQVTLAVNAATTVAAKNFTYGTDDTAAMVACRDFCWAFPGTSMIVPNGRYCINGEYEWARRGFSMVAEGPNVNVEAFHAGKCMSLYGRAFDVYGVHNEEFGGAYQIKIRGNSGSTVGLYMNNLLRGRVTAKVRDVAGVAFKAEKDPSGIGNFGFVSMDMDLEVGDGNDGPMDVKPQQAFELSDFTDCRLNLIGESCGAPGFMGGVMDNMVRNIFTGTVEANSHGGLWVKAGCYGNNFECIHNEFNGSGPDWLFDASYNSLTQPHALGEPTPDLFQMNGSYNLIEGGQINNLTFGAAASRNTFRSVQFYGTITDPNGTNKFESCTGAGVIDKGYPPPSIAPTYLGTFVPGIAPFQPLGITNLSDGSFMLQGGTGGGAIAPTDMFTLPVGYRPLGEVRFDAANIDSGGSSQISVSASGVVRKLAGNANDRLCFSVRLLRG